MPISFDLNDEWSGESQTDIEPEPDAEQQMNKEYIHAFETNGPSLNASLITSPGCASAIGCHEGKQRKFLNNEDRRAISYLLLQHYKDERVVGWGIKKAASMYSVSHSVIKRIWKQIKLGDNVCYKKTENCGRKMVGLDPNQFLQVPFVKRTTLRDLSCALNINKTSLVRLHKKGVIQRRSNTIKPFFKEENMVSRLQFCLSMIENANASVPRDLTFKSMHNIVHLDEKWFYMTKKKVNYYMLLEEVDPLRAVQNKNFIGKVMFLVAIARPRFDSEGNETFSGKIGVFPLITQEPAKRKSANRPAGTLISKVA